MAALLIGIPVKEIVGWYGYILEACQYIIIHLFIISEYALLFRFRWRICFWVSTIPAALLALAMVFCAESPYWLYKVCLIPCIE